MCYRLIVKMNSSTEVNAYKLVREIEKFFLDSILKLYLEILKDHLIHHRLQSKTLQILFLKNCIDIKRKQHPTKHHLTAVDHNGSVRMDIGL